MNDMIIPDEKRHLDFAFTKFCDLKYPVYVDKRIYTSAHSGGLHNHDYPQIWYCLGGNYLHQVEDQVYECAKGSVVVIPSGVFHKFRIQEGEEAEILSLSVMYDIFLNIPIHQYLNAFAALFLPPFATELGCTFPVYLILSRESQKIVEANISWLASIRFDPQGKNIDLKICDKLEEIFRLPEFALPENYRKKAVLLSKSRYCPMVRALSYLNIHYAKKIEEKELLQVSSICHSELYRHFKRFTGYTVSEYHRTLRFKHAYFFLKHTAYPLSYISDVCGFYNLSHMTKLFRKYMGQTSRDFRLEYKEHLEKKPDWLSDIKNI